MGNKFYRHTVGTQAFREVWGHVYIKKFLILTLLVPDIFPNTDPDPGGSNGSESSGSGTLQRQFYGHVRFFSADGSFSPWLKVFAWKACSLSAN